MNKDEFKKWVRERNPHNQDDPLWRGVAFISWEDSAHVTYNMLSNKEPKQLYMGPEFTTKDKIRDSIVKENDRLRVQLAIAQKTLMDLNEQCRGWKTGNLDGLRDDLKYIQEETKNILNQIDIIPLDVRKVKCHADIFDTIDENKTPEFDGTLIVWSNE